LRPYNVVVTSVVSYSRKEKEDGIQKYACFPVSGGQKPSKMSIRDCFRVVTLVVVSWFQVERHIKVVYLCAVVDWWWAETPETSIQGSFSLVI